MQTHLMLSPVVGSKCGAVGEATGAAQGSRMRCVDVYPVNVSCCFSKLNWFVL